MKRLPEFFCKRDPQTLAEWDALATFLGVVSGEILREQIRLADEIITEILNEEKTAVADPKSTKNSKP